MTSLCILQLHLELIVGETHMSSLYMDEVRSDCSTRLNFVQAHYLSSFSPGLSSTLHWTPAVFFSSIIRRMTYMMTTRTTVSTASFTLPGPSSITTLVTLKDDVKHLRTDVDDQLRLWRGDVDDALVHERHRYTSGLAQVRAESNQEMMGIKSQLAMLKSRCDTLESEVKVLRRTSQECLNAPGPHVR